MNILVLCTGNSARSIMLESALNHLGRGRLTAFSAGSAPVGKIHPAAVSLLSEHGYPTHGLRSKSWDEFSGPNAPIMDMVITVCGKARDEICPLWPGAPLKGHWGIADPAAITSSHKATAAAFSVAFAVLEARAKSWLSTDFEHSSAAERQRDISQVGEFSLVM
ncbi:MAG: arsenate reductase ArsC [Rhodobacteraceae bacterium]|nr:arsenate reductase ArsC [Paracoccaceae bacterium]